MDTDIQVRPTSILILISVFRDFIFQIFSLVHFMISPANLDPNSLIFGSVDCSLSVLSKYIKIPNFYPCIIVRFDQISKDPLKLP